MTTLRTDTFSGSTNNYAYNSNGSMIGRTNIASSIKHKHVYVRLMNKLSSVTASSSVGSSTTSFQYNDQESVRTLGAIGNKYYLIDAGNHTGYQQVLEEFSNAWWESTMSYVIGDDVLGQGEWFSTSSLLP